MANYKERIAMKFNVSQLDKIIVALLNNAFNKKFAGNVKRLFDLFKADSFKNDYEKEYRVHLIKLVVNTITKNGVDTRESLLNYLEIDGKYYNDCTELLNNLYEMEISDTELNMLDKLISNQLRYSAIIENSTQLSDMLINIQNENYDSLEDALVEFEGKVDSISNDIKSARESIEDAKKDLNLASSGFVTFLDGVIKKERNPATKIRTGIQYMNTMLNGGFERGRLYCALGVAKGWKSLARHLK